MSNYFLMHKDDICGSLILDDDDGKILAYKDNGSGKSPFLGKCDNRLIKKWWESRAVPGSRKLIREAIKKSNCLNTESYLAKNLALSMTDSYWIRPIDTDIKYDNIKLSGLLKYDISQIPFHNETSYDPNASLGGQMEKYWDLNHTIPLLIKESYKYFGQQSINEMVSSNIHCMQDVQIPFVIYTLNKTNDNGVISICQAFTNDNVELISAYEVIESLKLENNLSLYDNYIKACVNLGIEETTIQNFMDYQTLTDFVISNTDEHLMNFGILRDANSMEIIGPAPIYDSGNSMFYSEGNKIYNRVELLERKITGFYESEEKVLTNVKNKNIVNIDLLPSTNNIIESYIKYGVPEEKALTIGKNYETKIEMLHDFQRGIKISLYSEKQKNKNHSIETNETLSRITLRHKSK